jgi:hypothetical protein
MLDIQDRIEAARFQDRILSSKISRIRYTGN